MLNLVLLVLGFFVEVISAILIAAPILLPIASAYGIHPVQLGIIMLINLEIGLLTPPVGLNLIFAAQTFQQRYLDVARAVLPFITMMSVVLMLVTFVPQISLFFVR